MLAGPPEQQNQAARVLLEFMKVCKEARFDLFSRPSLSHAHAIPAVLVVFVCDHQICHQIYLAWAFSFIYFRCPK